MNVTDGEENIRIRQNDECTVCGGYYPYQTRMCKGSKIPYEISLITSHPCCRSAMKRVIKYQTKLLNEEFNLFLLKYNKYSN